MLFYVSFQPFYCCVVFHCVATLMYSPFVGLPTLFSPRIHIWGMSK